MRTITLVFNRISVNTYLLLSEDGKCAVIDPGCSDSTEENRLAQQLDGLGAEVTHILLTHAHADHIQGCEWMKKRYPQAIFAAHAGCAKDYGMANAYGSFFGFPERKYPPIDQALADGDILTFGKERLHVLYTPGHAEGSVCYYHRESGLLFSGDTLFCGSVGRTDLPGGSAETLLRSIQTKIACLPDTVTVYPGHGEPTQIGMEKRYNPYF
ncbi:MAG: MBL fold metallo-hydrolase [Bacteroidales bacterium]|nr:MBL fold metallo-hydrolase [Bacteroidales bacterium]